MTVDTLHLPFKVQTGDLTMTPPRPTMTDIVADVSARRRIPVDILRGKRKAKPIVLARHEAMYLMRQQKRATGEYRYSASQIGRFFGTDHSSALHGVRRHAERNGL